LIPNRFRLRITLTDDISGAFGCYYFNSGHIEIKHGLKPLTFILTLTHELCHWILDCFNASYYSQQWVDYVDSSLCRNYVARDQTYKIMSKLQQLKLTHKHYMYFYSNTKLWYKIHSES
jgi:hypothetical protein